MSSPGKFRTRTINIATGTVIEFNFAAPESEVQYPKTWFDNNPYKKPHIILPKYTSEKIELLDLLRGGIAEGNLSLNTAKLFIYNQFQGVKAKPINTWTSFGRQLGSSAQKMTPWDLVEVSFEGDYKPTEPVDGGAHRWSNRAVLLFLLSIYRISKVTNYKYREMLEQRLKEQLYVEGGRDIPYGGAFQFYSSWAKDPNYMKMIAAIDMFLYKFKTHSYAIMRMGTSVSRHRDCAGLITFGFAMKILGITSSELLDWIFVRETGNEIRKLTSPDQEAVLPDSYFPYQANFQLVERSAYSSVANPYFFHWVHIIGSLLGHKRSQNARFTFKGCLSDISLNATIVAWVFRQGAGGKDYGKDIEIGELEEKEDVKDSVKDRLWIDTQERNPKTWFALLKSSGFRPPRCVIRMIKKQKERIHDARPNTIGEYVKNQFSY